MPYSQLKVHVIPQVSFGSLLISEISGKPGIRNKQYCDIDVAHVGDPSSFTGIFN